MTALGGGAWRVLHRFGGLTTKDRRIRGSGREGPDKDNYRDSGLDETESRMKAGGCVGLGLRKRGLELQRCGCGDFVEGEVLGGTAGALFPGEEQAAVALGEASGGGDAHSDLV